MANDGKGSARRIRLRTAASEKMPHRSRNQRCSGLATIARARGVTHTAMPAMHGPRVVAGAFDIQTLNNLDAAL